MSKIALKIDEKDNIATAIEDVDGADAVSIKGQDEHEEIFSNSKVPRGHKIALKEIKKGEFVIKYGETIGVALSDIRKGDYVHVHNLDSVRGKVKGGKDE